MLQQQRQINVPKSVLHVQNCFFLLSRPVDFFVVLVAVAV